MGMKGSKCCSANEENIKSRRNKRNPYKTTKVKSPDPIPADDIPFDECCTLCIDGCLS